MVETNHNMTIDDRIARNRTAIEYAEGRLNIEEKIGQEFSLVLSFRDGNSSADRDEEEVERVDDINKKYLLPNRVPFSSSYIKGITVQG